MSLRSLRVGAILIAGTSALVLTGCSSPSSSTTATTSTTSTTAATTTSSTASSTSAPSTSTPAGASNLAVTDSLRTQLLDAGAATSTSHRLTSPGYSPGRRIPRTIPPRRRTGRRPGSFRVARPNRRRSRAKTTVRISSSPWRWAARGRSTTMGSVVSGVRRALCRSPQGCLPCGAGSQVDVGPQASDELRTDTPRAGLPAGHLDLDGAPRG